MKSLVHRIESQNITRISLLSVLIVTALFAMSCSRKFSPEEKAIKLVEESRALAGDLSVKLTIEKWLKEKGEEVKPIGWKVSKKNDQVYLVSYKYKIYSFREGTGERGFFFEVDLNSGSVRNVTRRFTRKLDPLASPFEKEEEISEKLMQKIREKEETLPGSTP